MTGVEHRQGLGHECAFLFSERAMVVETHEGLLQFQSQKVRSGFKKISCVRLIAQGKKRREAQSFPRPIHFKRHRIVRDRLKLLGNGKRISKKPRRRINTHQHHRTPHGGDGLWMLRVNRFDPKTEWKFNLDRIVSVPPTPESRKGVALSLQINCFPIDGYGCWRFKPAGYPSVDCERHGLRSFNAKLDLAVLRIAGGLNDLDRNALYRDVRFRGNEQVYVNPVMTSEIDSKKTIRHILHQCS